MPRLCWSWRSDFSKSKTLSRKAKAVGQVLSMHMSDSGEFCRPSLSRLEMETSMSRKTVMAAIEELIAEGWLTRVGLEREGRTRNGHSTFEYLPRWPDDPDSDGGILASDGGISDDETVEFGNHTLLGKSVKDNQTIFHETEEHRKAAQRYASIVKAYRTDHSNVRTKTWAKTIRLMCQRDGLTVVDIFGALEWALAHKFWFAHVLSPEKLRKHWSSIAAQRGGLQMPKHVKDPMCADCRTNMATIIMQGQPGRCGPCMAAWERRS